MRGFLQRFYEQFIRQHAEAWIYHHLIMRWHCFGPRDRVRLGENVELLDAVLNTASGTITIGDHSFCGHRVNIVTGSHDMQLTGYQRNTTWVESGNDIVIGSGVWLGTASTILGPCRIGDNSVVAAGALVNRDVPANVVVGGVPARVIRRIEL